MKISSRQIVKSAEVYGAEATVYTGSRSEPEDFLRLTVGGEWNPGRGIGSAYGKGLYSVYNLDGTSTSRGGYGRWIYKLRVNLYGFISFNEDITQKIYGSKLKPSQQYRMVYGENKFVIRSLEELEKNNVGSYTSVIARPASNFLRGIVKGILFTGEQDGDVVVIYDANVVTPISYKHLDGDGEWKKFEKEKVKESIGRGMAGSFEPKKYDEDEDEGKGDEKYIKHLSNIESKLDKKSLQYVYYLIKNNPYGFLNQFSEKEWAKEARPELNGISYLGIVAKAYAKRKPRDFLYHFSEKPWAETYINDAAKDCSEKNPYEFLRDFSEKPWAEPYINGAAKACAEKNPFDFLLSFSKKPWAEPYIKDVARTYVGQDPYSFLIYFSENPWAEPYINGAAKAYIKKDPYEFLYRLSEKPWAEPYLGVAAKDCSEKSPFLFLNYFSENPWAEPYRNDAAEIYAKEEPYSFLNRFSEKPWAEPYVGIAAKAYIKKDPADFLYRFSEKDWAKEARSELKGKSYVDLAREALNAKKLNQTASQVNVKLLKLAKVLRSLRSEGLSKEISQIKDLARTRY